MEKITTRQIPYTLEIVESGNRTIKVMAICEAGCKEFDYNYNMSFDRHIIEAIDKEDFDYLIDDFSDVETWVDSMVVASVVGELSRACILKSVDDNYYTYNTYTDGEFKVVVLHNYKTGGGYTVLDKFIANGVESINDLIWRLGNEK
jgi:hypothetical protein